jgi:hypothetical protein
MSSDDWSDLFAEPEETKPEPQPTVVPKEEVPKEDVVMETKPETTTQEIHDSPTTTTVMVSPTPTELTVEEAKVGPQVVIVVFGDKGAGKTYSTFSLDGTIFCLSFDKKSLAVKVNSYKNDQRIKVFDVIKYWDESNAQTLLDTSVLTFEYTLKILEVARKEQPDWVVIDGLEVEQQICEMTMRARNNIQPFAGFPNRNLWKERNMYMRQIHNLAMSACKKGLIYTTYLQNEPEYKNGEIVNTTPVPKWADIVHRESDVVIRVYAEQEKMGRKFYAIVESSKSPLFVTGMRADITSVGLKGLLVSKN